ncbi:MAG: hypothetical protein COA99_11730 [Moraxellaceae bacterium]|nr:MAG: hypothetical protein COA99_11730 [Moraxellaceae bacterium]
MSIKAIATTLSMVFVAVSGQAFADTGHAEKANTEMAKDAPAAGQEETAMAKDEVAAEETTTENAATTEETTATEAAK